MECNKDEAVRAKSIAEAKLEKKDFISAKKFALKAQTLYPNLDGISKMLMTIDVYISAEDRINGQINWYSVLAISHTADEETIKKQYRKLALMLHPDKNNSVGAEGAFKLISEASSFLSDKQKRLSYNLVTGFNGPQQKVPTNTSRPGPSNVQPGPSNVQQKVPTKTNRPGPDPNEKKPTAPKPQKKTAKVAPANEKVKSFWTICGQCRVCHEFHYMYLNTKILCPECKTPFMASEIPKPVTKSRQQQQRQSGNNNISISHAPLSDKNDQVVPDVRKPGAGPKIQRNTKRAPSSTSAKTNASVGGSKKRTKVERNETVGGSKKKTKLDSCSGDVNGK